MRRLLVLVIVVAMVLTFISCNYDSKTNILKRLEKTLDKYTGYRTDLYMKTIMNEEENQYKMRETYTLGNKYKLEILEPVGNQGITIEYKDDKIYIKHASLSQSLEISAVKNFDQGLLIGKFFREPTKIRGIEVRELEKTKYYVFTNDLQDKNRYNNKQEIWLYKKDFKPYMLKILDRSNNPRVIIEYSNFEFVN